MTEPIHSPVLRMAVRIQSTPIMGTALLGISEPSWPMIAIDFLPNAMGLPLKIVHPFPTFRVKLSTMDSL
jgi:hypothetical protein